MDDSAPLPPFTLKSALAGARAGIPVGLSSFAYGIAWGALARATGLSFAEAALMSALVFAGSAQYPALLAWTAAPSFVPIVLATLAINARHLLFGAALRPWLRRLPARKSYGCLLVMSDANFLLSVRAWRSGLADAAFLPGAGAALWIGWVSGSAIGHAAGAALGDIRTLGLDVVLPAFLVTMAAGAWRGRNDLVPFATGGAVAFLWASAAPGAWHVLAGALAGALAVESQQVVLG